MRAGGRVVWTLLLAWSSALAGCAGTGGGPDGEGPPGDPGGSDAVVAPTALEAGEERCYRFQESETARALDLPWGVALSGSAPEGLAEPGDRRAAATLAEDGARGPIPFATWRPLPGDSVQVDPLLTGRLQLRLAVTDEGLRGLGRPIGDAVRPAGPDRPAPTEGVEARSVACPAPS